MKMLLRYGTPFLLALAVSAGARADEVRFERDASLPLVRLNWLVKGGATLDPSGMDGLTSLMANLLARGTLRRDRRAIDEALDKMGANLSVDARAESVVLRGTVLSSEWRAFADLLGEIVTEPAFRESEFAGLRKEEIGKAHDRMSSDDEIASLAFERLLFGPHPFGKAVEGTPKSLANVTLDAIHAQYVSLFRKGRLVLVGSGDAEPSEVARYARAVTGRLPFSEAPGAPKLAEPADGAKRRVVLVERPGRTQSQIRFGQVGMTMLDPRHFPYQVANHAFGGGSFSARLMKEVRVKRGWSYGAYASPRFGTVPREWVVNLFPSIQDTAPALGLALGLAAEFAKNGLDRAEFDEAKESLLQSAAFLSDTAAKRVENAILEESLGLPRGFFARQREGIASVTWEQANAAVKDFLRPDRFAIAVVGTADLREPLALAAGILPQDVTVYRYPNYGEP